MDKQPTLEQLLRMQVTTLPNGVPLRDKHGFPVKISPDFRIAIQDITDHGVRIIVHASGYDSDTLDFWVCGDKLEKI